MVNSKPAEAVALAGRLPISSKPDPAQHGLGSQIVADIAQLYEGVVRYEDEGERYKVVVMLKI